MEWLMNVLDRVDQDSQRARLLDGRGVLALQRLDGRFMAQATLSSCGAAGKGVLSG
jgi:hypothetical protein